MRGDQIAFESATRKGLNLKPFAHQLLRPTELRVLLIFRYCTPTIAYSAIAYYGVESTICAPATAYSVRCVPILCSFCFEFQVLFYSSVSRVVVSFFPFRFSFRVFSVYFIFFYGTTEFKPES